LKADTKVHESVGISNLKSKWGISLKNEEKTKGTVTPKFYFTTSPA
jgi:hypothetical protein